MGLNLDDPLHKFDTAYFDRIRKRIPSAQDVLLHGRHILPDRGVVWVVDTA
jgi:hypothetical protein